MPAATPLRSREPLVAIVTVVLATACSMAPQAAVAYFFLHGGRPSDAVVRGAFLVLDLARYAAVAIAVVVLGRTRRRRVLGVTLVVACFLLTVAMSYAGAALVAADPHRAVWWIHHVTPWVAGPEMLLIVVAWGVARRSGRRWALGLPVAYALLVLGSHLSRWIESAEHGSVEMMLFWLTVAQGTVPVMLAVGGVVCWLLERTESTPPLELTASSVSTSPTD